MPGRKHLAALLLLGLAGAAVYDLFFTPPKPADPAPPPAAPAAAPEPAAHRPAPARLEMKGVTQLSVPAPRRSGRATPDPRGDGRTVEFQVVEGGLAVAFGDILLGKVDAGATAKSGRYEPPALQLWERPEIPYAINPELPDPSRVEKAIAYFNEHTPVSFVPYTNQPDAVVFEAGEEHCYSSLGRMGGLQPIKLSPGCQPQEIMHELMHALGFVHEQSRVDRDQYVTVLWDNIEERFQPQFYEVPDSLMEAERGTAFDFRSIMLYRPDTFAAQPGLTTLAPQAGRPAIEPSQQGLSDGDIGRLKRLYRL